VDLDCLTMKWLRQAGQLTAVSNGPSICPASEEKTLVVARPLAALDSHAAPCHACWGKVGTPALARVRSGSSKQAPPRTAGFFLKKIDDLKAPGPTVTPPGQAPRPTGRGAFPSRARLVGPARPGHRRPLGSGHGQEATRRTSKAANLTQRSVTVEKRD
jgi:hypothetical protein